MQYFITSYLHSLINEKTSLGKRLGSFCALVIMLFILKSFIEEGGEKIRISIFIMLPSDESKKRLLTLNFKFLNQMENKFA